LVSLVEPMLAGMTATRPHLLAWVHAERLAALDEVFREEAEAMAGPKGRHQTARTHHHWGTTATELTFGGRRLQVVRPRVQEPGGHPAVGGGLPGPRSAECARDAAGAGRGVDAELRGESGAVAGRAADAWE
jgi:hypothetical protein